MKAIILSLALLISISVFAEDNTTPNSPDKTAYNENFLLPGGFFNVNYNLGWGAGNFNDFISTISYRGFSMDARWFTYDRVAFGGQLGWNGFSEKHPIKTYVFDNGAVTGKLKNTYYNFTMTANAYYYPFPEGIIKPFIGANFGPIYQTVTTQIGRVYDESNSWQFMVAPELGAFVQFGPDSDVGLNLAIRYNYVTYHNTFRGFDNGLSYFQGVMGLSFMF